LENQLVVGILTETNQFVPLAAPEENKMRDELKTIDEDHRVDATIQKGELNPKDKVIQSLKVEQMFYHAFFNTLKVELNDAARLGVRKQLEAAIPAKDMASLKQALDPVIEQKFIFVDQYDIDVYELTHVNLCKHDEPYCQGGKLLIPKVNLFHRGDNSKMYPSRFMEDLLMNVHVQRIVLEEIHSTLYYTDRYQLSDHEILLLESELSTYLEKEPVRKIHAAFYPLLEDVPPQKILEYIDRVEPVEESEKIVFEGSNLEDEVEDEPDEIEEPVKEPKEDSEPKEPVNLVEYKQEDEEPEDEEPEDKEKEIKEPLFNEPKEDSEAEEPETVKEPEDVNEPKPVKEPEAEEPEAVKEPEEPEEVNEPKPVKEPEDSDSEDEFAILDDDSKLKAEILIQLPDKTVTIALVDSGSSSSLITTELVPKNTTIKEESAPWNTQVGTFTTKKATPIHYKKGCVNYFSRV
jgi:hypothetical protein